MSAESPAPDASGRHQAQIAEITQRAQGAGLVLRCLPAKPLTCCGRGCNGCVWEGYFAALEHWVEDAEKNLECY